MGTTRFDDFFHLANVARIPIACYTPKGVYLEIKREANASLFISFGCIILPPKSCSKCDAFLALCRYKSPLLHCSK